MVAARPAVLAVVRTSLSPFHFPFSIFYNQGVANHAYARFWCRDFSEENKLELFERLLETVPSSATQPGFTSLTIRAVDFRETPLAEHDLRQRPATAAELIAVCREHSGADMLCEAEAAWDLWAFADGNWQLRPHQVTLSCWGETFDDGAFAENGHFQLDAGFEHLFTGHAGLLRPRPPAPASDGPQHPAEAEFLRRMTDPANLSVYHQKTRENITRLLAWAQRVQAILPMERFALWSEGEENFEARLDEILAAHL